MKKNVTLVLVLMVVFAISSFAKNPTFDLGGFEQAKSKAIAEGKYLFVEFHAQWCMPCKWMDETAFSDDKIKGKLEDDYVAVKMDIDGKEGFELRTKFDVQVLPTMLIFDQDGMMVERIEETMSPSRLYAVLNRYEASTTTQRYVHKMNTSPSEIIKMTEEKKEDSMVLSREEYKKYLTAPDQSTYKMQMGVFGSYDGAATMAKALRKDFADHIYIMQDHRGEQPMYRVIMGEFGSMNEAESFRKILRDHHNLESIIL